MAFPIRVPYGRLAVLLRQIRYTQLMEDVPQPNVDLIRSGVSALLSSSADEWYEPPRRPWNRPDALPPVAEILERVRQKRSACRFLVDRLWFPVKQAFPSGGANRLRVMQATDELIREELLDSLSDDAQDHVARFLMEKAMTVSRVSPWSGVIEDSKIAICG